MPKRKVPSSPVSNTPKKQVRPSCNHEGCTNIAIEGGVCLRHGANIKRCNHEGCNNYAKKGGVCVRHGEKKPICNHEGCTNQVVKGGVCIRHGAKTKRCNHEGCTNEARNGGVCIRHGATRTKKICSHEGCTHHARRGGVCTTHGATRTSCSHEHCTNIAVKGGLCSRHRNGGVCVQHGATWTKRNCSHEGCTNRAVEGGVCIRHGGTQTRKICDHEGCTHHARTGGVCIRHGTTQKRQICNHEGCASFAKKGGLCYRHRKEDEGIVSADTNNASTKREIRAPTKKSMTRGSNETNDESDPSEIPDTQQANTPSKRSVRTAERVAKRHSSSRNTKEVLQSDGRRKKPKRSAIRESGTNAKRSDLESSESNSVEKLSKVEISNASTEKQVLDEVINTSCNGDGDEINESISECVLKDSDDDRTQVADVENIVDGDDDGENIVAENRPPTKKSGVCSAGGSTEENATCSNFDDDIDVSQLGESGEEANTVDENNESNKASIANDQNNDVSAMNIMECVPSAESTRNVDGMALVGDTNPAFAAELEKFKAHAEERFAQKLSEMMKDLKASHEDELMSARQLAEAAAVARVTLELEETQAAAMERVTRELKETHKKDTEQMLVDAAISHKEDLENSHVQHKADVECITRELKESHRKEMEHQQSETMAATERKHRADIDRITCELKESHKNEMAVHTQPTSKGVVANNAMTTSDESKERAELNGLTCSQLDTPRNAKKTSPKRRKNQGMSSLANLELLSTLQLARCLRSSTVSHEL